ncbi:MAG: hypothetical protein ACRC41_00705 [Sarcina sp.]
MSDRKILLGIGIGILIGSFSMIFAEQKVEISKSKIEKNARNYGMHYENECKVIFDKGDEK